MAITYFISKYIFFFNDALCEIGEPLNEFMLKKQNACVNTCIV